MQHLGPTAVLGIASLAPCLLALNLPPSPTLLNQCLAIGLWGAAAASLAQRLDCRELVSGFRNAWVLQTALAALILATALAGTAGTLPMPIGRGNAALLLSTAVVAALGCALANSDAATESATSFMYGLIIAGALSALVGAVQVLAPDWPDGEIVARSALPGRAVGNLRQPNHLSSLLLWSMIGAFGLLELRILRIRPFWVFTVLTMFGLVLSGSRTGALGAIVLAFWGLADRRLRRPTRVALLAAPLLFGLLWAGLWLWGQLGNHPFGAEGRMNLHGGDLSSSRFAIWSNTLVLIVREPWTGVGFGEFNLAWTLSAFQDRPVAFFDHTHNLPLQLIIELGMPFGSLVMGLLLIALYQAWRRAWQAEGETAVMKRAAFMLVLMIGLHSLLEYPLWYAYFLLPTAFAWGFALARSRPEQHSAATAKSTTRRSWLLAAIGLAMTLGATAAVLDYRTVVVIYEPPLHSAPLEDRIALGQRSLLFAHHADYAAATAFGEPKAPLSPSQILAFQRAPHHLLDIRLMIAWSQALAAQGEVDKARWLAARIREFHNPGADEYFEPCAQPAEAAQAFQCQAPQRSYHWREFVAR